MMLLSRILITSTLLVSAVSALDVLIKDISCESRSLKLDFNYICNGDMLCTFGEVETMEGSFVYYGLVDQENATANDAVIIDANMYFHMTGYTHEQNLFNAVEMPLCHDGLGSDENNQYGACPNDGAYTFDTVYNMPEVDSPYFGWAATGWSGEVVLDMYLNSTMDLVGKCTMEVQTMVTGSYEEGAFRSMPSAKATTLTVFGVLAACLIGCMYCCWCKSKSKQAFSKEEGLLADTDDETATGQYLM